MQMEKCGDKGSSTRPIDSSCIAEPQISIKTDRLHKMNSNSPG